MKKTPKMKLVGLSLALMIGFLLCPQPAGATLTINYYRSATDSAYLSDIQITDLINPGQGCLLSASSSAAVFNGFALSGLTDGEGSFTDHTKSAFWNTGFPVTILFVLNTEVNTAGYDITQIQTIAGWYAKGFCDQAYTLSVQKMDNSWVLLGSGTDPLVDKDTDKTTKNVITDTSGTIASGVKAVQFVFSLPEGDSGLVLQEIDITGTPTPIPNSPRTRLQR